MRLLKYVLAFIIGMISTKVLFDIANAVHSENAKLNLILFIVIALSYTMLLVLFYIDRRPKL